MSLKFACEACGVKLVVKDEAQGRTIKCPKCGAMIGVPVSLVDSGDQPRSARCPHAFPIPACHASSARAAFPHRSRSWVLWGGASLAGLVVVLFVLAIVLMVPRFTNPRNWTDVLTLKTNQDNVECVQFTRDGKWLASGSADQTIKLWDVDNARESFTLTGHRYAVFAVAFSADGKTLFSGSPDSSVRLWDVETGNEIESLPGPFGPVNSLAISPDGQTLVTDAQGHPIRAESVFGV